MKNTNTMTNLKKPIPFYFDAKGFDNAKETFNNQLQLQNEVTNQTNQISHFKGLKLDFKGNVLNQLETFLQASETNTMKLKGNKLMELFDINLPMYIISKLDNEATEPQAENYTLFLETSEHKKRFEAFQGLKTAFENFKELNKPHISALAQAFPNQCYFNHGTQTVEPNTNYILGIKQRSY